MEGVFKKPGFYLQKNNKKVGYLTNSDSDNEFWVGILRNYCILKSFHSNFEVLHCIRNENFAQVFFFLF